METISPLQSNNSKLGNLIKSCKTKKAQGFTPIKKSFRIHGHSTTLRLEQNYWSVIGLISHDEDVSISKLIEIVNDICLIANEKNLASCLRVLCLKYLSVN